MMFKTPEDVAREYRRRYRRDPDPEAWDLAIEWRIVQDAIDDPAEIDSVIDRIRRLERLRRARRERRNEEEEEKELAPDQRAIALAQIRAIEAAGDPLVEAFRAECLPDGLLEPDRIQHWIEKRKSEQGVPARYEKRWERADGVRVDLPPNLAHYGIETKLEFGNSSRGVFLAYPDGSVQVSADSTLGRLKFLASALCHRHLWREDEAVGLILADIAPSPFLGRVTIRREPRAPRGSIEVDPEDRGDEVLASDPCEIIEVDTRVRAGKILPRAPRVTIEVDPRVRGGEVLRLYKWAQDPNAAKARSLSEIHTELAVFAAARNDGREWKRVLAEWNQTHRDNSYPEIRNFIRDCRKAYERITEKPLRWRRPRGAAANRQNKRPNRLREDMARKSERI